MSNEAFQAHNDRASYAAAERQRYLEDLTPEQMIVLVREGVSPDMYDAFNQTFSEIMDAQLTIHGADSVAEKWAQMCTEYEQRTASQ